mgnify:FL=1
MIGDNHGNTNTDIQITGSRSSPAGLGDEQSIDIHFGKKEFICIPNINTAVTFTAISSIDYSANINPLGLPQGVKEELARCIEEPVCCVYPDSQCRDLVKALADYHKVTQDWILCGDGAADLIFGLAFALKPKKALL